MKRSEFNYPRGKIYLCGNSLGLQPKRAKPEIEKELDKWARLGVEGHFQEEPWLEAEAKVANLMAPIIGAKYEHEIALLGGLSSNLHFLLAAFYKPQGRKFKIMIEQHCFPSDIVSSRPIPSLW